ncbi:MAG TPA: antibiotic biosynthesis monooxygenase [Candidatus Binataceae bacterium]|jgi:quinol monooxygenase YgiN|nr:antibiotic biosynthesis monooxygenase [Candidatus Binataceae bacterium]
MPSATDEKIYVVTHVDIMPTNTAEGTKLLRELGAESRRDKGVVRFEVLQEPPRPNHFTIVSVWENQAAFEHHLAADHTRSFRGKLQPLLGSPFDERVHRINE